MQRRDAGDPRRSKEVVIGLNMLTVGGDPAGADRQAGRPGTAGKPGRYEGRYTSQTGQKTSYLVVL